MLVQIPTTEPATLTAIVAILIAVALTACIAPSRRATRLDRASALRYE